MSETDEEFLSRLQPSWPGTNDSVRLPMSDFNRLFALARRGAHLCGTARSLGWPDDGGEGAFEFVVRLTREVAFEDARRGAAMQWRPIEEAPKEPVEEGWTRGPLIYVQPAWGGWDIGWWDLRLNCFRMTGDDGPGDEQPTHWMPLPPPPSGEPEHD